MAICKSQHFSIICVVHRLTICICWLDSNATTLTRFIVYKIVKFVILRRWVIAIVAYFCVDLAVSNLFARLCSQKNNGLVQCHY